MNADVYRTCFAELSKAASLGGAARAVGNFARDAGELTLRGFTPSGIREGFQAGKQQLLHGDAFSRIGVGVAVPFTAWDTANTLRTKTDPVSGKPIGVFERGATALGKVTSGVAGMTALNHGGLFRGLGVAMAAGLGTDMITRHAGRFLDRKLMPTAPQGGAAIGRMSSMYTARPTGRMGSMYAAHPATAAGGTPVARGA